MASRREVLAEFIRQKPHDCFARYGLAMEHVRAGEHAAALEEFGRLLEINPDYTAAYQQSAQLLATLGRTAEACEFLRRGIASAQREGNRHAETEMQGMLDQDAGRKLSG